MGSSTTHLVCKKGDSQVRYLETIPLTNRRSAFSFWTGSQLFVAVVYGFSCSWCTWFSLPLRGLPQWWLTGCWWKQEPTVFKPGPLGPMAQCPLWTTLMELFFSISEVGLKRNKNLGCLVHFNHLWMEPKEEVIFALPIARHEATWMVVECMVLLWCSYCWSGDLHCTDSIVGPLWTKFVALLNHQLPYLDSIEELVSLHTKFFKG